MDPIAAAIIGALDSSRNKDIQREYDSLKATLTQKFSAESELIQAVNRLEENPGSRARQAILHEAVARARAAEDQDVRQVVLVLVEQLKEPPGSDPDVDSRGETSRQEKL